jgi:hypothetical protein
MACGATQVVTPLVVRAAPFALRAGIAKMLERRRRRKNYRDNVEAVPGDACVAGIFARRAHDALLFFER